MLKFYIIKNNLNSKSTIHYTNHTLIRYHIQSGDKHRPATSYFVLIKSLSRRKHTFFNDNTLFDKKKKKLIPHPLSFFFYFLFTITITCGISFSYHNNLVFFSIHIFGLSRLYSVKLKNLWFF